MLSYLLFQQECPHHFLSCSNYNLPSTLPQTFRDDEDNCDKPFKFLTKKIISYLNYNPSLTVHVPLAAQMYTA